MVIGNSVQARDPVPTDGVALEGVSRSSQELAFWMNSVGAALVLVEKDCLNVRCGNRAAAVLFAKGTEPLIACEIEELVGPSATAMLGQIWSAAPVGVPGEPFLIRADTGVQESLLMVQVTKIAIDGDLLRLFTSTDAPPQGSVALAGWQENVISLLNWLPFGFEIASTHDQIQFANSTFKALFGYSQDEIEKSKTGGAWPIPIRSTETMCGRNGTRQSRPRERKAAR